MAHYETDTEHPNEVIFNENIHDKYFNIYKPDGTLLARSCNSLALNDVRIQIMQKKLKGYTVTVDGQDIKAEINENGKIVPKWPDGLCDLFETQLNVLIFGSHD